MILLESTRPPRRRATVFGVGLIGSAIVDAMLGREWSVDETQSFPWDDLDGQAGVLDGLVESLTATSQPSDGPLHVVWSAGRAGFGADEEEVTAELRSFTSVLNFAVRVRTATGLAVRFHLVSSAGGLYEGQRLVGPDSAPSPRRPYGRLKWSQEQLLAVAVGVQRHIYRVSSVFGAGGGDRRRGLIGTLVENSLHHGVTTIVGHMSTLRDYVSAADVARFVVDTMDADRDTTHLLASGRPTSILEIVRQVESAVRHPVSINCVPRPTNGVDITFSRSALPAGWSPRDVRVAIPGLVADAMRGAGSGSPLVRARG